MVSDGQIVLFEFPRTDQTTGKLRPALAIRKTPGPYDDWLICMISSQTDRAIEGFDEIIRPGDDDFDRSGLKESSVFRIARLAVVHQDILQGAIGEISPERVQRIRRKLSDWLRGN